MPNPSDIVTLRLTRARAGLAANALRAEASRDFDQANEDRRYDPQVADEVEATAREEIAVAEQIESRIGLG